jgi:hypothetical protein
MTSKATTNGIQTHHHTYRYGSFSFANADEDPYFTSHSPPEGLDFLKARADEFVAFQHARGKPVVLVTSGGSTVPLEVSDLAV